MDVPVIEDTLDLVWTAELIDEFVKYDEMDSMSVTCEFSLKIRGSIDDTVSLAGLTIIYNEYDILICHIIKYEPGIYGYN